MRVPTRDRLPLGDNRLGLLPDRLLGVLTLKFSAEGAADVDGNSGTFSNSGEAVTYVLGTFCCRCVRTGQVLFWR